VHYVQHQYFLFYIFLIWGGGCVHTQRTPLPTGLVMLLQTKHDAIHNTEPR